MVRPMKNASTISLIIHEFAFIQSRALGRRTVARLPSARTRSIGNASRSRLRRTKVTPSAHGSLWFSRLGGKKGNCEDGHDRDRSSEKVRSGVTLPSDAGGEKYCGYDLRASDHHKRQWQNRGRVHVHVPSCLPGGSTASNATWMSALPPAALLRSRALTARGPFEGVVVGVDQDVDHGQAGHAVPFLGCSWEEARAWVSLRKSPPSRFSC